MRKTVLSLMICSVAMMLTIPINAQLEEVRFSSYFGFREIQCERFAPTEQLDFVNYLEANEDYPEDEYLGFQMLMRFRNHSEMDMRFTLNSGWGLSGYNLKLRHYPTPFIGFSIGILRHPYYIYYFDDYLIERDQDYYTDPRNGSGHKYLVSADQGLMAGLVFPLEYRIFHLTMQIHGGASSIIPFQEEIGQKQKNSNFRRDLVFEAKNSYNWFVLPEAALYVDLLRIKDVRIGIQAQASWYVTQKYIDYNLTTYDWTYDSPQTLHIESPVHRLEKLEYDVGLVVWW